MKSHCSVKTETSASQAESQKSVSNAVVTIAEKIHQNWMADDNATAQAQQAASAETLRKLELV